jgi:CheY-like chemotaxis protein
MLKIYLPRMDEPLEEEKKNIEKEELPRGNETILVVEDEEEVRKVAVRMLGERGYKVLEASQGVDALHICAKLDGPIHLLLTDVVMPKMSGQEVAGSIISLRPGIKVLYMSGYTDNTIVHHGVLERGVNYIQKPFTVESLARKVREVLDN